MTSVHCKAEDINEWSNLITDGNLDGTVKIQHGTTNKKYVQQWEAKPTH